MTGLEAAEKSVAEMIGKAYTGASTSPAADPEPPEVVKFDFDESFQTRLAALILRDDEFVRRNGHMVKPDYFESIGEATMVGLVLRHYQRYGSIPDFRVLGEVIKDEARTGILRNKEVLREVARVRKELYVEPLTAREYVEEKLVRFVRHQAIGEAILKSVDLREKGEHDKIEALFKAAVSVGANEAGDTYDYFASIKERTEVRLDKAAGIAPPTGITTGMLKLDDLLYHKGWGRKELSIIMGGAKAGKCVTRDTLIFTEDGLAEIGEFVPSSVRPDTFAKHEMGILGMNGVEKTSHVYNSGLTPTIRIKTAHGLSIEGTRHHPMLTLSENGEHVWKTLQEIELGDFIVGQRGDRVYGTNVDLSHAVTAAAKREAESKRPDAMTPLSLPSAMTPDLAEWLAMVVAEGHCGPNGSVSFTQKDEVILNRFVSLTRGLFGMEADVIRREGKVAFARIQNVRLRIYLEALGIEWCNPIGKAIPECVLRAPRECVLSFLRALLGLKGCVRAETENKTVYDLTMVSKKIIRQVQMLLLNEGVISKYSEREGCATNGTRIMRPYYRLQVSGSRNLIGLQAIGLYESRKNVVLAAAVTRDTAAREWLPNQQQLVGEVMAEFQSCGKPLKSTLDPSFARALRCVRSGRAGEIRHLTFALAEKLLNVADAHGVRGVACSRLRELVTGRHFYVEVQEITHGEAETVDLTVPGTHSFFANGLVSHNTTALIGFAKAASLKGFNVLYVTLEVSKQIISERLDASITDTAVRDLRHHIIDVRDKVEELAKRAGKLMLEEFPSGTLTPNTLRGILQKHRDKGNIFDMVVVDYADIMAPNYRAKDAIENSKSVYVDLRALATEFNVAMLTATQTNRDGFKAVVAKAEHVADDFNKVRTADIIISINKTEEEASNGEARLYFAASRNQESGFTVYIKQDIARMQFITSIIKVE